MRSQPNTWQQQLSARREPRPALRRWQRVVFSLGAIVLLAVVAAGAIALYLTSTEHGRRSLADRLEDVVSGQLPGEMRIGELERVGARRLVVRDLRFLQTNGEPVLTVARAEIDADVSRLLRGEIAFESARVRGGHLIIAVEPHGATGLEAAFSEQQEAPQDGDGATLDLRSIHVQDLTLTLRPSRDDLFRMRDVEGFVSIVQRGPPGVRVRLEGISGTLVEPKFLGATAEIRRADGLVRGGAERVLALELRAALDDEPVDTELVYWNRERPPTVELTLDPKESARARVLAAAAEFRTLFSSTVDVRVR